MWGEQEEENFYEEEIQYANQRVSYVNSRPLREPTNVPQPLTVPSPPVRKESASYGNQQSQDVHRNPPQHDHKSTRKWKIAAVVLAIIAILLLVAIFILLIVNISQMQRIGSELGLNEALSAKDMAKSCLDLQKLGTSVSGVNKIRPQNEYGAIEAFCDMETDDGGWTLVASIHEDDITKKCDASDRWSNYVPPGRTESGRTNWDNKRIFGDVSRCTNDDYKNSAYHSLISNDVMIWHVPSGTPTDTMKSHSTLRYRTTNKFLQTVGGNLRSLFDEHYPIKIKSLPLDSIFSSRTKLVLDVLEEKSAALKSQISNWYTYTYEEGDIYRIKDSSLFNSYGNQIQFGFQRITRGYLHYERDYKFEWPRFVVNTRKSEPFIMATAISNEEGYSEYFETQEYSTRKLGDVSNLLEKNIILDDFELQYIAVQQIATETPDPTLCGFHFIVFNEKAWRSARPSSFKMTTSLPTDSVSKSFRVDGSPSNFVMGYLLLTRTSGNVTYSQTDGIANIILQTISNSSSLSDLFNEHVNEDGLIVPVTFDIGNSSDILNTIPPDLKSHVEPGYLQFRAFNLTGFPNAICPGVKLKTDRPEFVCIGGLSEDLRATYGTCGDFAGWAGKIGDVIGDEESGSAHSRSDISSTILIFYR